MPRSTVTSVEPGLLAGGHYARKQLFSRSGVVRWSHSRRFATALALTAPYKGGRLLDYGCGDGTFLALAREMFPGASGADIAGDQVADCASRLAGTGLTFLEIDALCGPAHAARYDVVVCMEVLEHCPSDVRPAVLDHLRRLSAPGGVVVVSVPLETGASLVAKQSVRRVAAATGLAGYRHCERYSVRELATMIVANRATSIPREETVVERGGSVHRFTGHKGFNWRHVESELRARFELTTRVFSPLPSLGAMLNSQVWFVCRPIQ